MLGYMNSPSRPAASSSAYNKSDDENAFYMSEITYLWKDADTYLKNVPRINRIEGKKT